MIACREHSARGTRHVGGCNSSVADSALYLAETSDGYYRKNMRVTWILVLTLIIQNIVVSNAQSPNIMGAWDVEITFANNEHRAVRFEAKADGKGSLAIADPRSKVWDGSKSSDAQWSRGDHDSITFSGAVEFLIGNVGRDAGTLTCTGKFETADLITGEADFSPLVGERPSKLGSFKASRTAK